MDGIRDDATARGPAMTVASGTTARVAATEDVTAAAVADRAVAAAEESVAMQRTLDENAHELRRRLLGFVRRRIDSGPDAEDIVQDVLEKAWQKRNDLQESANLVAWLLQIARNRVADYYRLRRRRDELRDRVEASSVESSTITSDTDDVDAARRELASCLIPLIDDLPETYREAITSSEIEGRTQQETADILGLSLSGAKSRIQRGRRMVAERLLACCAVERDVRGGVVGYERRGGCVCG